ncbi:tricarballylate utilization 4Fe-4S protein TcuB [Tropicimonas sediminicola]|uniref:Citrate/tricarballylate utilization protein n=1 Tax=Tropicimonas sediminicola TaxID=1031541 RepID=A0A239LJZ0_9RHOB|nr:tricarballylate utilization 4Fe-4S protein TcuB [Tropicimonas sediminicola]SNT30896.1 citrate/tricarballylate utilization protein [Tropicimonas sediminicola]
MPLDLLQEARRQAEICNACRYCEGYCSVFPALHQKRVFTDGDITQLANLCHNCRGCYYACQYTAPHEFDLNLPKALAEVRRDSWERFAWPAPAARAFHTHGTMIAAASVLGFALLFLAIRAIGSAGGEGFYAALSHNAMVAIFAPAFLFPLASLAVGLRRYWRSVGGARIRWAHLVGAFGMVAKMKDLAAGHGDGCNFEEEDRFSHARRYAHQLVMYGFLLCFAATSAGTVMHYGFGLHAPYGLFSLPKLLGVPGGVMLAAGTGWIAWLKLSADREVGDATAWGGEMGFVLLLGFVAVSGLALYALGGTGAMPLMLALHLGAVLSFFLLTPYTKMAHGFYRLAALVRDAQRKQETAPGTGNEATA